MKLPLLSVFVLLSVVARTALAVSPLTITSLTNSPLVFLEEEGPSGSPFNLFETTLSLAFVQPPNASVSVYWSAVPVQTPYTGSSPTLINNQTTSGLASVNVIFANITGGVHVTASVVSPMGSTTASIYIPAPNLFVIKSSPSPTTVAVAVGSFLPYTCNVSMLGALPSSIEWTSQIGNSTSSVTLATATDTAYWYFDLYGNAISHVPYFATAPSLSSQAMQCAPLGTSAPASASSFNYLFCETYAVNPYDTSDSSVGWASANCNSVVPLGGSQDTWSQVSLSTTPLVPLGGQNFTVTVVANPVPGTNTSLAALNVTFGSAFTVFLNVSGNSSTLLVGNQTTPFYAPLVLSPGAYPNLTWTFTLQLPAALYSIYFALESGNNSTFSSAPQVLLVDSPFILGTISGPSTASVGSATVFSCAISGLGANSPVSILWNFGDGTSYQDHYAFGLPSVAINGTSTTTAVHQYNSVTPNATTVTLTVISLWGYSTSTNTSITVASSSTTCPTSSPTAAPTPAPTPTPAPCSTSTSTSASSPAPLDVQLANVPFWGWFIILLVAQFLVWILFLLLLHRCGCCSCHPRRMPSYGTP